MSEDVTSPIHKQNMLQAVGPLSDAQKATLSEVFQTHNFDIQFVDISDLTEAQVISFDQGATRRLQEEGRTFYNWDLLFSVLGPNDQVDDLEKKIAARLTVLSAIKSIKSRPHSDEFHGSIRVRDLAASARFYSWLFSIEPKEWTHRYVTFHRTDCRMNFVLLVADDRELHHDTLYHLGMGVKSKDEVVVYYHSALENNFHVEKPPRTTWRGTPLHELWLKDPDGTLIEIYARLTDEELTQMPEDKEPIDLC